MQKILLAITCLTITTAFANCDIYVSSYVNSNKLESGSLVHYDFDNLYDVYHSSSISLNAINDNYYVLGSRGDDFDCNTINYKGNPAFTIKLLPYCKTQINSKTIINMKKGDNLIMNCESNISINVFKEYNNLLNLSILPTGFDNITARVLIQSKNESSGIAFSLKNLSQVTSSISCIKSGKYYNCQSYKELKILFNQKSNNAKIDVFSFDHEEYTPIGDCAVTRVNKKPVVKCSTFPEYTKRYKIIAKSNSFITVIDPNNIN